MAPLGRHSDVCVHDEMSLPPACKPENDFPSFHEFFASFAGGRRRTLRAWRNVRAGHDLVKRKAEEFKKHQKSHTDSFSAKIEGLEQQLQEVTEKAEAAEEDIDKERMRHAKAKEHILQDAEDAILSLREKENASIEQQHRAEEKIAEAEEQLKHEQAELRAATRRHQQLLDSEQQREQQVEELIAKEKQEELEDEEAAEAREEAAEAAGEAADAR
ncbi:hypothetical protein Efla_002096 [Eimeria flavescens]